MSIVQSTILLKTRNILILLSPNLSIFKVLRPNLLTNSDSKGAI